MGDEISVVGWGTVETNADAQAELLLDRPSTLPANRRPLLVCPECGDLSCQSLTAIIERTGDTVVWRDFAYQHNWDAEIVPVDMPPLSFDATEYRRVLAGGTLLAQDPQENGT